ncbi:MAG: hypothetical protein EBR28_05170 [Planctomycetia bacterium]|nr:hypothetical protein [Planctomycetia bacterium]
MACLRGSRPSSWPPRGALVRTLVAACLVAAATPLAVQGQPVGDERPRAVQDDPDNPLVKPDEPEAQEPAPQSPSGSIAILPSAVWWLLVVGWLASTGWAARDEHRPKSFDAVWLPLLTIPFFVLALAAWWLPWSAAACGLTATAWGGSFLAYGLTRDAKLKPDQRVVSTRNAFHALLRSSQPLLRRMGIKLELESRSLADSLPEISLTAVPPDGAGPPQALLAAAQAAPGFEDLNMLLKRSVAMRAHQLLVEIDQNGGRVRQRIDGIWHPSRELVKRRHGLKTVDEWAESDPFDREESSGVVAAVRALCGMPPSRAKRQRGRFLIGVDKKSLPCGVALEATESATRLLFDVDLPPPVFKTLPALGMSEAMAEKVRTALTLQNGLVCVSAPPGEGLTTTFTQVVLAADRLLRDFVILEDAAAPGQEIQNVKPVRWGGPENVAPVAALETAMRGYPTGLVVANLTDKPLAAELARLSGEMLVIVGLQAADAAQAIRKLLDLGMPPGLLAQTLQVATCQRLLRRLCPKCAESYQPSAELLGRLRLPAAEGMTFRKAAPLGCPACSGTGHLGRGAMFEVAGGQKTSGSIAANADEATLRKDAMKDGMQRFRDAGIAMVVAGTASLEEVQRVLKKE